MKKVLAGIAVAIMIAVSGAVPAQAATVTVPRPLPASVAKRVASGTYCNFIFWQGGVSDLFRSRASLACWGSKLRTHKYRLRVKCLSSVTLTYRYRYTKYTKTGAERKMNCSAIEVMANATDQWKKI